ncbi:MAG: SPOR domain-containing protein [Candidatus Omnitrophota bacterium]
MIISNFQFPNPKQFPISKSQNFEQNTFGYWNFGNWVLFVIWCLLFGICTNAYAQTLNEAEIQYLRGDYKASIQTLEKILAQEVDKESSVRVYYLLGLSYLKEANYLRAGDCFDIIVKEYKNSNLAQHALIKLIDIDLLKGDCKKAKEDCQNFLNRYPYSDNGSIIILRQYQAYLECGDVKEAQVALSKLRTLYPNSPQIKALSEKNEVEAKDYFSVQVGYFKERKNAQNLSALLKEKGFDSFMEESKAEDNELYFRVKVGKFKSKDEAVLIEKQLRQEGYPTKIYP